MQHNNFVIFGEEPEYALHLKNVLISGNYPGYNVYIFKRVSAFKKFTEENKADILLINESIHKDVRKEMEALKKFVITTNKDVELNDDETEVYKYQRADAIIVSVTKKEDNKIKTLNINDKRLIGVYSPVHRIGNTTFAIELGQKLSEEEMVLYINMEGYSALECNLDEKEDGDIGDLIYYIHQENCHMANVISSIVSSKGQLDMISPVKVVRDLKTVQEKDWIMLFEKIFQETMYTTVIVDLGDMIQGLENILMQCEKVYTRYLPDQISKSKIQHYTDNLRATGYVEVLEHTILEEVEFKAGEY